MAVVSRPRGADWVIVSPAHPPIVSLIGYLLIQPGNLLFNVTLPRTRIKVNCRGSGRDPIQCFAKLNSLWLSFSFFFPPSFNSQYLQREPRSTQISGSPVDARTHTPTAAAQKNQTREGPAEPLSAALSPVIRVPLGRVHFHSSDVYYEAFERENVQKG